MMAESHRQTSDQRLSSSVAVHASRSETQSEFLERIANDVAEAFSAELLAVSHQAWETPRVLLSQDSSLEQYDSDIIEGLLNRSTVSPSATNLPIAAGAATARALTVRLLATQDSDSRSALLLAYPKDSSPSAVDQIKDLKRLSELADQCRSVMVNLDAEDQRATFRMGITESQPTILATSRRYLHQDLDLKATSFRVANELRRALAVDRVSVLLNQRRKYRTEAVSGVAVLDRRANSVAAAEQFAQSASVLGHPLTLPSDELTPPQISEPFDHYLDTTGTTAVTVIPLFSAQQKSESAHDSETTEVRSANSFLVDQSGERLPHAIVLLEHFEGQQNWDPSKSHLEILADASVALSNAREHERIFGRRFLQHLGDWFGGRKLPYTILALTSIIGLFAASLLIEIDHRVIASGLAEPQERRSVFASIDGTVKEILVSDGQSVSKGEVLLRLENADLESRVEDLSGKLQTSSQRLSSIDSLLLDPATEPSQAGRLAIERSQLESELRSLRSQLDLVRQQQQKLEVVSPISGRIEGWQLERTLFDRPIARGNELLVISDAEGPWQLKLEIPDEDTAEVLREFNQSGTLRVEFAAASHPEITFAAKLSWIASAARRRADGVNVVDALASIEEDPESPKLNVFASTETRTGVRTTAKIVCGRRSVLSSWFGDVADFFHRNVFFYFR
ncbi:MAG: biotin/lipoyl-binding protein [Planctomycetota bacterium]